MSCSVKGCDSVVYGHGLCSKHYQRWKKHGNPLGGRIENGLSLKWITAHLKHKNKIKCLKWPFTLRPDGYAETRHEGKAWLAHRLICTMVYGDAPTKKHEAAHLCGRGAEGCVNPHHLYWATRTRNEEDKKEHGTSNTGSRHGHAKLIEKDIIKIRKLRAAGHTQRAVAARYKVSPSVICQITNRKAWSHVK